jgi:hypothetical protein
MERHVYHLYLLASGVHIEVCFEAALKSKEKTIESNKKLGTRHQAR